MVWGARGDELARGEDFESRREQGLAKGLLLALQTGSMDKGLTEEKKKCLHEKKSSCKVMI